MKVDVFHDLMNLLTLERLEENLFRGQSRDIGSKQVFGGQVLGQALAAASLTVEGRSVHSLHAYFLRRGDVKAPIVYEVDRQRDGRSFTSRRVVAIQHGHPIFNMAASFHIEEEGIEHYGDMPDVPGPENLKDARDGTDERVSERLSRVMRHERPFDFRPVQSLEITAGEVSPPAKQIWIRSRGQLPDSQGVHRSMLAYVSDYGLITTPLRPHGITLNRDDLQIVSLDHGMWFHRPFRMDEWLLYDIDSPSASGARGFARGNFFTADGVLVASVVQEGLIRLWGDSKNGK